MNDTITIGELVVGFLSVFVYALIKTIIDTFKKK